MEELMKEIEKSKQERDLDQFHSPENLAKSIAIESGELLECFQCIINYNKLREDENGRYRSWEYCYKIFNDAHNTYYKKIIKYINQ